MRDFGLYEAAAKCYSLAVAMSLAVKFGTFELDLRVRELRKGGVRIRLPDQCIEILAMLVETPGQVVTRERIRKRLWPKRNDRRI